MHPLISELDSSSMVSGLNALAAWGTTTLLALTELCQAPGHYSAGRSDFETKFWLFYSISDRPLRIKCHFFCRKCKFFASGRTLHFLGRDTLHNPLACLVQAEVTKNHSRDPTNQSYKPYNVSKKFLARSAIYSIFDRLQLFQASFTL
jgi:hypothetical protein